MAAPRPFRSLSRKKPKFSKKPAAQVPPREDLAKNRRNLGIFRRNETGFRSLIIQSDDAKLAEALDALRFKRAGKVQSELDIRPGSAR